MCVQYTDNTLNAEQSCIKQSPIINVALTLETGSLYITHSLCTVGWCEIILLVKIQNHKEVYGSFIIPGQLLSKVFVHRMYHFYEIGLKQLTLYIVKSAVKITKSLKY